jgi:2-oxo-4-hydroxy-4-carboxy-5-ureidoimidazoline decarboxylase
MLSLTALNALREDQAAETLRACCTSAKWVAAMVAARPFTNRAALLECADAAWAATGPADWAEAFASHPRIGEPVNATTAGEQGRASEATASTRAELARANDEYERRFGRIFIICASGRSGDEILANLRARMDNTQEREMEIAAAEQQRITRLRLGKLISDTESA